MRHSKSFNPGDFKHTGATHGHVSKSDEQKFITVPQLNEILAAVREDTKSFTQARDHCAIFLGFYFGLRCGEAVMLNRRTFREIHHNRAWIVTLKTRKENDEKTPPYIEPQVIKYVQAYIKAMPARQQWFFEPLGCVGRHVVQWTLRQAFNKYAAAAGLDREYSWHSLRHGRGMQVWNLWHNQKAVQEMLRQSSMASSEFYVHLDPAKKDEAVKALGAQFVEA